ncbi:hypothetical protein [Vibrio parahaemolyticus]|uniref:hypothetical protein n=1 Tax=Vibrio parahaemolyticus TaxID=670 RepID=UPI000A1D6DF7|nr:hypothetical protein [Vibrio parahaemolyticus]MBX5339095.1 hypothetical protein [Vibrio parahaemolyticus]
MGKFDDDLDELGEKSPIIGKVLFLITALGFLVGVVTNVETVVQWVSKQFRIDVVSYKDFNWVEKGTGIDSDTLSFNYEIPEKWIHGMFATINSFSYTPDKLELRGFKVYISTYSSDFFQVESNHNVSEATLNIQGGQHFSVSETPSYIIEGSANDKNDDDKQYWFKSVSVPYDGTEYKITCTFSSAKGLCCVIQTRNQTS